MAHITSITCEKATYAAPFQQASLKWGVHRNRCCPLLVQTQVTWPVWQSQEAGQREWSLGCSEDSSWLLGKLKYTSTVPFFHCSNVWPKIWRWLWRNWRICIQYKFSLSGFGWIPGQPFVIQVLYPELGWPCVTIHNISLGFPFC